MTQAILPAGPTGDGLTTVARQIAAWAANLPRLPADDGSRYSVRRLTASWNLENWGNSSRTAVAHRRDLSGYLRWCVQERLDPLTARPTDLAQFRVWRELQAGAGGGTASASTVARALASVSSWYQHLIANTDGLVARNPAAAVKRPKVPATSTTAGLTEDEIDALLARADTDAADRAAAWRATPTDWYRGRYLAALRDRALLRLLADLGLRIGEALDRDLTDLRYNAGHRTLKFLAKGKVEREVPMPPHTLEALDEYLTIRAAVACTSVAALAGPLFATTGPDGRPGRLGQPRVFESIRRLATAAQIPSADQLSPDSLRHAFATSSRAAGVPLEDVQDAMGHADPRTTRRYDRDRDNLHRHPGHLLGARRASRRRVDTEQTEPEE
ncbi:tyrosine-type recombinase/integrase [Actinoplanes sp. L3-i22]|uniref:tyrosine-type recombinase/integrase n=1 Tax=Actinoplanes sp. L3-i22 TaxID=2836373 RepID=UPI001C771340|nr:tyrosine-type recombinase/integrase [Actinoplanes sp. L3-i22]BCY10962.1 tyrosine recombinase XerC [Actinoplanes sp. L3-i22]